MTDSQEDHRKQAVRLARAMMLISITLVTIPVPIAWWFGSGHGDEQCALLVASQGHGALEAHFGAPVRRA